MAGRDLMMQALSECRSSRSLIKYVRIRMSWINLFFTFAVCGAARYFLYVPVSGGGRTASPLPGYPIGSRAGIVSAIYCSGLLISSTDAGSNSLKKKA